MLSLLSALVLGLGIWSLGLMGASLKLKICKPCKMLGRAGQGNAKWHDQVGHNGMGENKLCGQSLEIELFSGFYATFWGLGFRLRV